MIASCAAFAWMVLVTASRAGDDPAVRRPHPGDVTIAEEAARGAPEERLLEEIELLQGLLGTEDVSGDDHADVRLRLAELYAANGWADKAVEQYVAIIKETPVSARVPDAYVGLGDHYFTANESYKALLAYKKATAYPDSRVYGYALYKLAWCYFNVGELSLAADTIDAAVAATPARSDLHAEAIEDQQRFRAEPR